MNVIQPVLNLDDLLRISVEFMNEIIGGRERGREGQDTHVHADNGEDNSERDRPLTSRPLN